MGLEAVIQDIRDKGQKEAEKIRSESKQDVDRILAAAKKHVDEIKKSADEVVEKQTAHFIGQEISSANLHVKRELLNTQKELLDQVYRTTLAEISRLPESFHNEAIKTLLARAKKEIPQGTIYCNSRDVKAVKALLKGNKEFAVYNVGQPVSIEGGLIVEGEGGDMKVDYSYKTFLDEVWESGLKDAADILFG